MALQPNPADVPELMAEGFMYFWHAHGFDETDAGSVERLSVNVRVAWDRLSPDMRLTFQKLVLDGGNTNLRRIRDAAREARAARANAAVGTEVVHGDDERTDDDEDDDMTTSYDADESGLDEEGSDSAMSTDEVIPLRQPILRPAVFDDDDDDDDSSEVSFYASEVPVSSSATPYTDEEAARPLQPTPVSGAWLASNVVGNFENASAAAEALLLLSDPSRYEQAMDSEDEDASVEAYEEGRNYVWYSEEYEYGYYGGN